MEVGRERERKNNQKFLAGSLHICQQAENSNVRTTCNWSTLDIKLLYKITNAYAIIFNVMIRHYLTKQWNEKERL